MTAAEQGARAARFATEASLEPRAPLAPATSSGPAPDASGIAKAVALLRETEQSMAVVQRMPPSSGTSAAAQHPALRQIEQRSEWHAMSAGACAHGYVQVQHCVGLRSKLLAFYVDTRQAHRLLCTPVHMLAY